MEKPDAATLHTLLKERYGNAWSPQSDAADTQVSEVLGTLLSHRSVRNYSDEPLPADILETIMAAAQSASSSSNLQAFSVVAVRNTERKARLPQRVMVHHEQYQNESADALAQYDASMNTFQRVQQMPEQDWTLQASRRVGGAEALTGRDRLVSALHALGFGLK